MSSKIELKPWAERPFELIYHAEIHYRRGSDYDRSLALISFDNSIEISIATYLSLKPIQRENRQYSKENVKKWMNNYHSKIDFFILEIDKRKLPKYKDKAEIVWYHDQRNEHYHGGSSSVPEQRTLDGIREVALWIFSVLYETSEVNINIKLDHAISESDKSMPSIPDSFVVPREPANSKDHYEPAQTKALAIASLLGRWNEKSDYDLRIIRRLANGF